MSFAGRRRPFSSVRRRYYRSPVTARYVIGVATKTISLYYCCRYLRCVFASSNSAGTGCTFFFFFIEPGRVDNTVATTTFAPRAHDLENKFNIATPPPPPPACCTRVCTSRARAVQRTRALCVSPCAKTVASSPISENTFIPVRESRKKHAPNSLRDRSRLT